MQLAETESLSMGPSDDGGDSYEPDIRSCPAFFALAHLAFAAVEQSGDETTCGVNGAIAVAALAKWG